MPAPSATPTPTVKTVSLHLCSFFLDSLTEGGGGGGGGGMRGGTCASLRTCGFSL